MHLNFKATNIGYRRHYEVALRKQKFRFVLVILLGCGKHM